MATHSVRALNQGAERGDHCYYCCDNDKLEKETICHCIECDIFFCHKWKQDDFLYKHNTECPHFTVYL